MRLVGPGVCSLAGPLGPTGRRSGLIASRPRQAINKSHRRNVHDHLRLPTLIPANSVLAFATNRHTVAASSE
jgi:hypothetical protein